MQSKLIILRKKGNITQQALADYLNITLKTYNNKEQGISKFTCDEMFALSMYFNKPLEDIFLPSTHQNGEFDNIWSTKLKNKN